MQKRKDKPVLKTILWGALTLGLYAAVFLKGSALVQVFARGKWYAALPITTVFLFSFVHGTFASNLWSLLGIEARKQLRRQPEKQKRVEKRKRPRPRPQLRAR